MLADILWFIFGAIVFGAAIVATYGQYLLLKDRDEYRKQHGVDPWRERPNIDNE